MRREDEDRRCMVMASQSGGLIYLSITSEDVCVRTHNTQTQFKLVLKMWWESNPWFYKTNLFKTNLFQIWICYIGFANNGAAVTMYNCSYRQDVRLESQKEILVRLPAMRRKAGRNERRKCMVRASGPMSTSTQGFIAGGWVMLTSPVSPDAANPMAASSGRGTRRGTRH